MKRFTFASMRNFSKLCSVAVLMLASTVATAAPASLDELLEQTKTARAREEQANKEREAKFLSERTSKRRC